MALSADPLGGSYLVESLTDELEMLARERIAKIDAMGGMLEAIEQQYPQGEIENSAYEAQRAVESGSSRVVGVNVNCDSENSAPPILTIDKKVENDEQAALEAFKLGRNMAGVKKSLVGLKTVAQGEGLGLMEAMVECVRRSCTLGEISDTLREVFGEYH